MPSKFAEGTSVAVGRTKAEIERTLRRYRADDIIFGDSGRLGRAFVSFVFQDLPLRIEIPLPQESEARFTRTPSSKKQRSEAQAHAAWEKACRQQWRVLLLIIKANLEAVENKLLAAEEVFLPWLVLAGGDRVIDRSLPQIAAALAGGSLKALPFGNS